MSANPHRGECEVTDPETGRTHRIRFTWDAIARLRQAFGEGFDEALATAAQDFDLETLEKAAAIGLMHEDPEITPEQVRAMSLPLMPLVRALNRAAELAFFGIDGPPAEAKEAGSGPPRKAGRSASRKRAKKR